VLARLGAAVGRATAAPPWTNVYGTARTLLALCTLGTITFSSTATLFRPALGVPPAPYCDGIAAGSIYCLVPGDALGVARLVSIAVLVLAASGWRPRWTAVPQWWVTASLAVSSTIPDGGDQIAGLATLLLLPLCLTDPRRWHWQAPPGPDHAGATPALRVVAWSAVLVVRVQVAGIYLQAAVAKFGVEEWADGTALYYWMTDPAFGAPGWAEGLVAPVITSSAVVALTYGAMLLELVLFTALVMPRQRWGPLLVAGLVFHGAIAVLMGLLSFGFAMAGCLLVYLRPADQPLRPPARLTAARLPARLAEPLSDLARRLPGRGVTVPKGTT
jgi:antimicrobial peptide system SdpB family protein